ncbi:MAG TPA: lipoyl(octanoyl) transferase LipB [Spirochaetota bacterium]|nr:lipoyl(octanoyl) transferase LipB [Spirochaetota bacterium]HPI88375.1 lipoyl(octanoyl) transferase LipB [Spirochaetota bacterium]HPR46767.1 lipoyl(octanoyl) transferase LipB [Spirochaetota bacterium]
MKKPDFNIYTLGSVDYDTAFMFQQQAYNRVLNMKDSGSVFFLEHDPPVITLGKRSNPENILYPQEELEKRGYQIRNTTRGGDVTVHEKGQLVIYIVFPVKSKTSGIFVSSLMSIIIDVIKQKWSIEVSYDPGNPGIWIQDRKLGSIGFDLRNGTSLHGIAINVCNTLDGFNLINPCGMRDLKVTTLEKELGYNVDISSVITEISEAFKLYFYADSK